MKTYRYRLTITFTSGNQWKLGVETQAVGGTVARELSRGAADVANVCLSHEKTGKIIWLRAGRDFLS